ncbi:MAG: O-antigen ligase family protein [Fusobacteriaceae bacterium]
MFFFIILITCLFSQKIAEKKIRLLINVSIFLNVATFVRLLFRNEIGKSIGEFNYLNMTLSLGFVLSILLNEILEGNSSLKKKILVFSFLLFCQFSYPARGVIVYLLLVVLFYLIKTLNKFQLKKLLILICILLMSYYIILKMKFASSYNVLSRFQKINNFNELSISRTQIWEVYKENINFQIILFGNGVHKSYELLEMKNLGGAYPHNIFLEILADFGVIPLIFFILILIKILYSYKKYDLNKKILMIGFFYYIFQFSKSFSLYSSYMIWILIPIFLYENKKV